MKACGIWAQVSHVHRSENASPHVCRMLYKATVQVVLLFGSETWNLSALVLKCLEGFHLDAACCMMGMVPKRGDNVTWFYPSLEDVLEAVGLHMIKNNIDVRRQTITSFIVNWPILDLCRRG